MLNSILNNIPELLDIVKEAGDSILDVYQSADFKVETKNDESPLTLADKKSNAVICERLSLLFPDIPILSEENKEIEYSTRKDFEYYWCVDPLDGTKEFIKRNGDFTVNVALMYNGFPVFGCVQIPTQNLIYYALEGKGAFKVEGDNTVKVKTGTYTEADKGLRIVCSRSHLNEETSEFIKSYDECVLVSRGSSLKFLIIAEGHAEIYPRIAPTMEWDTAAAQIILEQSGGEVVNFDTKERLNYNKESLVNPSFIARAKRLI